MSNLRSLRLTKHAPLDPHDARVRVAQVATSNAQTHLAPHVAALKAQLQVVRRGRNLHSKDLHCRLKALRPNVVISCCAHLKPPSSTSAAILCREEWVATEPQLTQGRELVELVNVSPAVDAAITQQQRLEVGKRRLACLLPVINMHTMTRCQRCCMLWLLLLLFTDGCGVWWGAAKQRGWADVAARKCYAGDVVAAEGQPLQAWQASQAQDLLPAADVVVLKAQNLQW